VACGRGGGRGKKLKTVNLQNIGFGKCRNKMASPQNIVPSALK